MPQKNNTVKNRYLFRMSSRNFICFGLTDIWLTAKKKLYLFTSLQTIVREYFVPDNDFIIIKVNGGMLCAFAIGSRCYDTRR